jgi:broad specificity phosphatase PhoE
VRLLWIRHGQMELRASAGLDARAIDRLFNQEDEAGLSPRGRREAELVATRLRDERVDALYSSPMLRARETGEVSAAALEMPLTITPAISELKTGHLVAESTTAAYVRTMMRAPVPAPVKRALLGGTLIPLYFRAWRRGRTVGGETPAALDARVFGFLAELERSHPPDATVALFAHGYLVFTLTHGLARSTQKRLGLWRRPYIPNGGFTEMALERGALRLVSYGDARHLRDR